MNLTAHPELKAYRDELASSFGGPRIPACERANPTAHRLYTAAVKHADARRGNKGVRDKDISRSVRLVVAEVRRTVGVTEAVTPKAKAKPGKRKKSAIGEAVSAAVNRVVAEVMSGKAAPEPDSRPLHELTNDELENRLSEALVRTGQSQRVTETTQPDPPRSAMLDVDLTGDPTALQGLSDGDFADFAGAALITAGEQRLGTPMFGHGRPVPPFMRGL